jgi:hypothetical protein
MPESGTDQWGADGASMNVRRPRTRLMCGQFIEQSELTLLRTTSAHGNREPGAFVLTD